MAQQVITFNQFDGGLSTDKQIGIPHSFAEAEFLDFRKSPAHLTVLPGTRNEANSVVDDLIQNSVMTDDGTIYALGNTGFFYKRTPAGVWSVEADLDNGATGLNYRKDVDKLFATSYNTISVFTPVSNSPTMQVNKLSDSASTTSVLAAGTETYTLQTTISETANAIQEYTPDIEPASRIRVYVAAKGTGDWTLTLHDAENNTLATSTVTNANVSSATTLDFVFSSQVRQYVRPNARTYHFHLTSTVADGTVYCSTAGNLNTCGYTYYADRLISTNNGLHPMETFIANTCIGNGRYLATWEPLSENPGNSEFLRHKLTFPPNLEVCGLAALNEYLAIACEQKPTAGNAQEGYIYFWDGIAASYNYFVRIPEGSPQSLHEHKNVLYYFAGGAWYTMAGKDTRKIRTMPNTDSEYTDVTDTTVVYPYMATVRRGVHLLGFPSTTTDTNVKYGVYSYGAVDKGFPDSFGYSYAMSSYDKYNTSGNMQLGHVKNYGDKLFVSWRAADGNYGIDVVDNSSDPAPTATWESIEFEDELPTKEKEALYMTIGFDTLPSNVTITPKYNINESVWVLGNVSYTSANTPENYIQLHISKRFRKIQIGFNVDLTGATATPTFGSISLIYDNLIKESLN